MELIKQIQNKPMAKYDTSALAIFTMYVLGKVKFKVIADIRL